MGLSRNKVAVSEGAAGSPPFYGDTDMLSRACRIVSRQTKDGRERDARAEEILAQVLFNFEGPNLQVNNPIWGCSSAGRAPALQAGGHGFDSHHLHQDDENLDHQSK